MLIPVVLTITIAAAMRMLLGPQLQVVLSACALYYQAMWSIFVKKGSYDEIRCLCGAPRIPWSSKIAEKASVPKMSRDQEFRLFAAVWLHTLSLNFKLWDKPHYRTTSLRQDLVDNFSNIAFPSTGVPMSWVCCCRPVAVLYLLFCHPWIVLCVSLVVMRSKDHCEGRDFGRVFEEELLAPKHWFALWRINSTLVAAHHEAHADQPKVQNEYRYENKWDFLELALQQAKLPAGANTFKVTPVITDVPEMVCKHKNIEGGMGIHMFKNAVHGGDWILQERLDNCKELKALLPETAPLSTFRVITMIDPTQPFESSHMAMTFVWRAGRAGKNTDHSSVLYAVDPDTLKILDGKMFSNWYQVGKVGSTNLLSKRGVTKHPDSGRDLKGEVLKCADSATENCIEAHRRLMPNVPVIGWDVAVAEGHGSVLLEANLSCNFFGGIYDRHRYLLMFDT
jgi:hypothetical protein